ncbi:Ataxin-7-like protein 3 [Podila epicladia]|nr:Ataxin-7-like protein 3 [Podila epicladia]
MDKSLASKDSADSGSASLASLSFEILSELLDEIVLDVVSESHREVKNMRSISVRAGLDIFGQNPQSNNTQTYDCVHCQRSFPAQRYAPHLEKCLGLAGRASSRVASRRMGAGERAGSGSPFTPVSYSDDREASDSDKDVIEKKRKKNANNGGGYASGNGSSSAKENGDYSAPSSSKSTSVSIKIKKPKQSDNPDFPIKPPKSSSTGKGSKGSSTKLKGLGLFTPPTGSAPRPPTPVGEISLGFLDDSLLLANGRTLQNGGGSAGSSAPVSTPQKLSSSNPKRANASSSSSGSGAGAGSASATVSVSSQKRPPGGNIDGDGDEDGMDILQTPKKKKS